MALSAMILAATLAAPALSAENNQEVTRAFPQIRGRQPRDSAASVVQAQITPEGDIRNCQVLAVKGDQASGSKVCDLIAKKKAKPALGPDQRPAYGLLLTMLQLVSPGSKNAAEISAFSLTPDIQLAVAGLPDEAGPGLNLALNLMVDPTGVVTECELPPPAPAGASRAATADLLAQSGGRGGRGANVRMPDLPKIPEPGVSAAPYAPTVCKHLKQQRLDVMNGIDGRPVPYVRQVYVYLARNTATAAAK